MTIDRLYQDSKLAQFYDFDNEWTPDYDYYIELAKNAHAILDLGCGTGMLTNKIALTYPDKVIFGSDLAGPMLNIAQSKPAGSRITWIQSDAKQLALPQKFDLIILSGHAFQVFLTHQDRVAVLKRIHDHLAEGGKCIFDSRNPLVKEWLTWTATDSQREFFHPTLGPILAWNDFRIDDDIVTYGTYYQILNDKQEHQACSAITFASVDDIQQALIEANLIATDVLGNWQGDAYHDQAEEMIFIARKNE
ncbi:class I SAM-dependent methyltransferase [Xenorhabdus lircayensis]|uniref:Class I SAM-dependent methyltransferase n=1 Tax=Xenorhabdus lircayensis TaxID=2763499 RepID=A0ABS0U0E7_9GAMM|nr:class I SAM-dependent methyltransferase [Xenorhabdus lircayensis]MBI6547348.1 class I SAM-dependent methyltransferase [Xenorhabdus lircayensis]